MSEKNVFLAAFYNEHFDLIFFNLINITSHVMRYYLWQIKFYVTSKNVRVLFSVIFNCNFTELGVNSYC